MAEPALQTREFVDADGVEKVYYYHIVDGHNGSHNVVVTAEAAEKIEEIADTTEKLAAIDAYLVESHGEWQKEAVPLLAEREVQQPPEEGH